MNETLTKMIQEKESKVKELQARSDKSEDINELRNLNNQVKEILADIESLKKANVNEERQFNPLKSTTLHNGEFDEKGKIEERAKKFAETNKMVISNEETRASILVSSNKIAQPVGVGGINDPVPQVSSIVDLVKVVDASNMGGGYKIAYEKSTANAATHTEGGVITESEPEFGYLTVTATDKALVSYISNKVRKQSPLAYETKARDSASIALRKAASQMIINHLETSTLAEVYNIGVTGTAAKTGVLDEKFLRKLTLNYGGDEAVLGNSVLVLNKKDLIALGDIRGTNEKRAVYEITPDAANPNTGIIKDGGLAVRYVINNNCKALSGTTQTTSAIKGIFYGNPQAIELALFSDYEISTSEDYKFAEDMLAVRGTVSLGVGMGIDKGFVVAQIPASA